MKLLSFVRDGLEERSHDGFICVVDKKGNTLKEIDDCKNTHFYLRSCAKPFQVLPAIYYNIELSKKELAICSASHAGTNEHIKILKGLLEKFDIDKKKLKLKSHFPLDKNSRHALIKEEKEPDILHNNCCGKHIAMLAVCKKNRWDIDSYLDFENPLQKEIYDLTQNLCQINIKYKTLDGCGTPIYAAPLRNIGLGFLNIFTEKKYEVLKEAFLENPYLIGGNDRQDTQIMQLSKNLIAKVGAEGLIVVVNIKKEEALVVKIKDANMQARFLTTLISLKQLCWISPEVVDKSGLLDLDIKTQSLKKVGLIKPLFNLK